MTTSPIPSNEPKAEPDYWAQLQPIFADLYSLDEIGRRRPLLAHYTSEAALEGILRTNELWFSNPLHMNDRDELLFGLMGGYQLIMESEAVSKALGSTERARVFVDALRYIYDQFDRDHLLDTYAFCASEHPNVGHDGDAHHWGMYGDDGKGAAIVFDTGQITLVDSSPLLISQVRYGNRNERLAWLAKHVEILALILSQNHFPDEKLYLAAAAVFEALKLRSLFMKDCSFAPEHEWRVVYLSDRDTDAVLKDRCDFAHKKNGVRPVLKFPFEHIPGASSPDLSLGKLVKEIVAGPRSCADPLGIGLRSVRRMVEKLRPELGDRVRGSNTPYTGNAR